MLRRVLIIAALAGCPADPSPVADAPKATSSSTANVTPPLPEPKGCSGNFEADGSALAQLPITPLATLLADRPKAGLFRTEGFAVSWHPCPPCPPSGDCPTCHMTIELSGHGSDTGKSMKLRVPKPSAFHRGKKYRVAIEICEGVIEQRGKPQPVQDAVKSSPTSR